VQRVITFPILDIIVVCLGASFAIFANMLSFIMIGKINERVPENERISYLWWGTEVRKKFKQIYPDNRLVLLLDSCVVLMVLLFVLLVCLDIGFSSDLGL
jgi:hypothetical protein